MSNSLWPHGLQPGLPVHHQLLEFTQTHVHWVSDAIQPSHPLLSRLFPPSIFPIIKIFSNESVLHIRWPKYLSFSVNISPSNEYSGLIFFRIDWLDLLAVQGTLQESSSTRQFKSINYSTPNFLYSPTLTINTNIKSVYCTLETNVTCQLYYNEVENKNFLKKSSR